MNSRVATNERTTRETTIRLRLDLDGTGRSENSTGLGFLDHMLDALARHSGFDLDLRATGDLDVDDHHTVEDCALALGTAIDEALADRRGVQRFGSAYAPLDEALARTVIDLSGRPFAHVDIPFRRDMIGEVATENIVHFFTSLAMNARCTLHLDVLRGDNDHHKAEAAFKSCALALRAAVTRDTADERVPSTKGVLT